MAQGDFTKEESKVVREVVNELFEAIPKTRRINYLGHLNDVLLFLDAAERNATSRTIPGKESDTND